MNDFGRDDLFEQASRAEILIKVMAETLAGVDLVRTHEARG